MNKLNRYLFCNDKTKAHEIKILKEKNKYLLYEGDILLSSIEFEEHNYLNLVHIFNVHTNIKYRKKGYATTLLKEISKDSVNPLYLFVEKYNFNALSLYDKIGFKFIKEYTIEGKIYYIMAKGNYDINKLKELNFK